MEIRKIRLSWTQAVAITLIIFGILLRLLPHMPNFAPVGAIALFGGAVLGWRTAIWLPLIIMIGADMVIGVYPGMVFTWAGFVLVSLFGTMLRNANLPMRIGMGAIGSGAIFFIVSNLGVWAMGELYPHTIAGIIDCYYMALPFFRTSLLADFFYSTVLFGTYALAVRVAALTQRANNQSPS
jgi:hypothetical protein